MTLTFDLSKVGVVTAKLAMARVENPGFPNNFMPPPSPATP
eukprot:CAMPEP_0172597032 /NCGR_PEP_ID=MMETSP1068-20121228/16962_1 /TAXON_ID=35684 /ORGANISM="Pseudopedinella elastica, Strain CCMP716" /LENGTH=40 /DNA_ID= /DNA_START= /DNA_END= /DNA_ORIENTATION=